MVSRSANERPVAGNGFEAQGELTIPSPTIELILREIAAGDKLEVVAEKYGIPVATISSWQETRNGRVPSTGMGAMARTTGRYSKEFKEEVLALLGSRDLDQAVAALQRYPHRQVVNPLFSFILSTDPEIKWAAVTAMGAVVGDLADQDREAARVMVRRLMWQLNDESGGIGWGCPESIGEISACHDGLAREYAHVLISYIDEKSNFLEHEPLQRGAVWAIGRVAQVRARRVGSAARHLAAFLESPDAALRGHAVWALGLLAHRDSVPRLDALAADGAELTLFRNRRIETTAVAHLASEALTRIRSGA